MVINKKEIVNVKIGTRPMSQLVLWEKYKDGDKTIIGMDRKLYQELHPSFRKLRECQYWKLYFVERISEDGILFLKL